MTIPLYPEIIYKGDLTPDAVGDEINGKIEVMDAGESFW